MLFRATALSGRLLPGLWTAALFGLTVYAIGIYNEITHYSLNGLGIYPRDFAGLSGIPVSWAIHGSPTHLMNNTLPLVILGAFIAVRSRVTYLKVTVFVIATSGLLVWLLGKEALHLGASGVVFGYLGYLLARGVVERSPPAVMLAFLAVLLYGGILVGILPGQHGVSWESHLFGFVAGTVASRYFPNRMRRPPPALRVVSSASHEAPAIPRDDLTQR